jgi:hypothetical protein
MLSLAVMILRQALGGRRWPPSPVGAAVSTHIAALQDARQTSGPAGLPPQKMGIFCFSVKAAFTKFSHRAGMRSAWHFVFGQPWNRLADAENSRFAV